MNAAWSIWGTLSIWARTFITFRTLGRPQARCYVDANGPWGISVTLWDSLWPLGFYKWCNNTRNWILKKKKKHFQGYIDWLSIWGPLTLARQLGVHRHAATSILMVREAFADPPWVVTPNPNPPQSTSLPLSHSILGGFSRAVQPNGNNMSRTTVRCPACSWSHFRRKCKSYL